jgi:hypothetical protein
MLRAAATPKYAAKQSSEKKNESQELFA